MSFFKDPADNTNVRSLLVEGDSEEDLLKFPVLNEKRESPLRLHSIKARSRGV
jgi:hypothetical protein